MTPESIRAQVRKIIASRAMARSGRLARFLDFTVSQTLEGHGDQLKEFVIGVEVFDRRQDYDPRLDPIVRVEARRLRMKLAKYYETEGLADALTIEYPKGGYAPAIRLGRDAQNSHEKRRAIVVLPFTHPDGTEECEYLTGGLTEELIDALTKIEGLRVVAWHSRVQWNSRIGDELQVDVVLEGSVRAYAPGWARVAAQLVSARDNSYLWTGTFERPIDELFSVRDAIAGGVAGALQVKPSAPRAQTRSMDAHHAYLKGRYHWNKRTDEAVARGIEHLENAIAIDPKYALAYAGLADGHIVLAKFGAVLAREAMPKAYNAARRALQLDPTLAEAHVSLGSIAALYDWDWDAAEEHFQRGLRMNPGYATGHQWYAHDLLMGLGRFEEAEAALDRARECDPLSLVVLASSGENMIMQRRPAAALEFYSKAIELDAYFPRAHFGLARVLLALGRNREAVAAVDRGSALIPGSAIALALEGSVYAAVGRVEEAGHRVAVLEEMAARERVAPYTMMRAWMALDPDRACDYLELAYEERDPRLTHAAVSPVFESLRASPRFEVVLRSMGLAAEIVLT
jgi:TolB-like protein